MSRTVAVALPVPRLGLLTYTVPEGVALAPGVRVGVPLGRRTATGFVVALDPPLDAGVDAASLKPILRVIDDTPLVPPPSIALARWVAEYYAAGPGEALALTLPPVARGRDHAFKTTRIAELTPAGRAAADVTPRQRAAIAALDARGGRAPVPALAADGVSAAVVATLAKKGLVTIATATVDRDPLASPRALAAPAGTQPLAVALTAEQQAALARLDALAGERRFAVAVLHGVTGSGKTQVYLRLADAVRKTGRRVLILVPEIALTPAMAALLRAAFGDQVAIQHSALSAGERHDQWHRIRRGDVSVVVGTRSAVFAPLGRIGLVIVDEEHDASYKQEESPRYNGRDVAIVRAQRAGALVVLGSATPSMESYFHAMSGKFERVVLERRVMDRPLAAVSIVDMREEYAAAGPDVILSRALTAAIGLRLERREQSLVLLNRRGFATAVFCRQCAGTLECPNCSVSLVVHGEGGGRGDAAGALSSAARARCHYCNYSTWIPGKCPLCAGPYLEQTGFGTERVEAEVARLCPEARVARLDRDAVRRKGALDTILTRFRDGAIDVLVGTQMIAKGHDFPRVTLVGVISADVGLGLADFRASERTFQLLTQVAGRAGRGDQSGEAVVQTLYPTHYSVQLACRQDYPAFYERELHFRRTMRYPPLLSLVNVVVRAKTFGGAMDDAADIVQRLRPDNDRDYRVLGPAPAPIGRLRGEYRAQLLLKGTNRKRMREALMTALAERPDLARRTVVDVDPVSVL